MRRRRWILNRKPSRSTRPRLPRAAITPSHRLDGAVPEVHRASAQGHRLRLPTVAGSASVRAGDGMTDAELAMRVVVVLVALTVGVACLLAMLMAGLEGLDRDQDF